MNLHHLRYFLSVAQTGSFSRAAQEMHVTQPTVGTEAISEQSPPRMIRSTPSAPTPTSSWSMKLTKTISGLPSASRSATMGVIMTSVDAGTTSVPTGGGQEH